MSVEFQKAMPLEILAAGETSRRPALLFVHGAFSGGWIWAEHFLPFFAERGWRCLAVSLSGHGGSAGRKQLDSFGVADYVADVAEAADGLDPAPVIVGHSMGGLVGQRFAIEHKASGLALLAPASLAGLGGSLIHMALRRPDLLLALNRVQGHGMREADYGAIRRGLFSADLPDDLALRYGTRFQAESLRVNFEMMFPQWLYAVGRPRLPTLVLGGSDDSFIPYADLLLTSAIWGAELKVLGGVPHAMMLDTSWRRAAEALAAWLERRFGQDSA